ncbi:MAG: hypothetical protein HY906_11315 [Deltaproteobacteria bacterium]|nr:hypothetical protein [Deltaproteobacteria bacterium]
MTPSRADDPTRSLSPRKRPTAAAEGPGEAAASWEERLLGFDARVATPTDWPATRRSQYLLRPDVTQPCSADSRVWPSLFDRPGHVRPSYVGFFQDLWEDLEHLRAHVPRGSPRDRVLVGVTVQARQGGWTGQSPLAPVLGGRVFDAFSGLPLPLPFARPSARDRAWPLIGYDVADTSGLSGLSNCGYDLGFEREELQGTYAARLNDGHLFTTADDADEFRRMCDRRVPEHAPFFVYGLWRVPRGPGAAPEGRP